MTHESNPNVDCLFCFTARPFDENTGLQNNLNRWYEPTTGKWLSTDPVSYKSGDVNLYWYVNNSPVLYIDSIGYQRVIPTPQGVRNCLKIHTQYHVPEKEGPCSCNSSMGLKDLEEATKRVMTIVHGREYYLDSKCDYILPDSRALGSRQQEAMHKRELAKWKKILKNCEELIKAKKLACVYTNCKCIV